MRNQGFIGRVRRLLALVLSTALMASCGGEIALLAGVGSGGTGGVSLGVIAGFGSVIVNDVHFDETRGARVLDDQGKQVATDALQLGMVVQVEGSVDDAAATGVANTIQIISEAHGPVADLSSSSKSFSVLGLKIRTTTATVWGGSLDSFSSLSTGAQVEAYGLYDSVAKELVATRVESADTLEYHVRGEVGLVDAPNRRFQFGSISVDYRTAVVRGFSGNVPTAGSLVRLSFNGPPARPSDPWVAQEVALFAAPAASLAAGGTRLAVEGRIRDFTSAAAFTVQSTNIDASGANVIFSGGPRADLKSGARVDVTGSLVGGVLVASRVKLELTEEEESRYEVTGSVSAPPGANSMVVRGTTITWPNASVFASGSSASQIRVGATVEVQGVVSGKVIQATSIRVR
jgi:hypothetical protein